MDNLNDFEFLKPEISPVGERKTIINIHPACVTNDGLTRLNRQVRTSQYNTGKDFYDGHMEVESWHISGKGKKIG